jgi:hypothetical protein
MSFKSLLSVLLAKVETTYGTDAVPIGGANAILAANVKINPMMQDVVARKVIRPYLSNDGKIMGARHGELSFDVEIAGSGAAGTAPAWGTLLKGCAMSETITAGVSTLYAPVSSGEQSLTMYFNVNGLQYKMLGARGSFSMKFTQKAVPVMSFKFIGLYSPVTDTVLPTPTLTAFQKPLVVSPQNTTPVTVQGFAGAFSDISLDIANTNVYRPLVGSESVVFTDRNPAGKLVMENVAIATKDFWTIVNNATVGAFSLTHGTTAGNKVIIGAPVVQLTAPTITSQDNIEMLDMAMDLQPNSGNDELTITVQ